jgi:homoserine kinase
MPDGRTSTEDARRALKSSVALRDAVYNIGHGALVVQALVTGDHDLLRVALRDRLHQDERLALAPAAGAVFEELSHAVPVCVSGSGPSLLAFESPATRVPDPGTGWRVLRVPVRATGVEVVGT